MTCAHDRIRYCLRGIIKVTNEEREEARTALHRVYDENQRAGFNAVGMISGYLESDSPSYAAVGKSARGNHGTVDREDMLTELLISYFENDKGGEDQEVNETMTFVYDVMNKAGYDAVMQFVGYLLSDDPSYITSKENARWKISHIGRSELIWELVTSYFK